MSLSLPSMRALKVSAGIAYPPVIMDGHTDAGISSRIMMKAHEEAITRAVDENHRHIRVVQQLCAFQASTEQPYLGESGFLEAGQKIR
jgi:hypothetical protein